jgi:hypothetical protein
MLQHTVLNKVLTRENHFDILNLEKSKFLSCDVSFGSTRS